MGATVLSTFDEFVRLDSVSCHACGVTFAMPSGMLQARRSDHQIFWCPSGHELCFRDSEEARLRRALDVEKRARERSDELYRVARKDADHNRTELRKTKTQLRNTKARIANGVCPCCHRSFVQLTRHMTTKHPGYAS